MESVFISIAFLLGFALRQVGLPPLIGFLIAGFVLKGLGYSSSPVIGVLAELGVTLLLFSIGLKLKLETLFKPEVWAGTSLHMLAIVMAFGFAALGLAGAGLMFFTDLDIWQCLLVAFALSFSSTVFTVKALEEKGESRSLHGRVAIGILIMQDVIAVIFITISLGKAPSVWAFGLLALFVARPILFGILDRCGHGELVPLFGLSAALILSAAAFDAVGLKADLGALILGVLLSKHARADEVSNSLLSFKDVFLVGFFLNIGLSGSLSLDAALIALLLILVLPIKSGLFFLLLTRFRLRARSASIATLSLSTYSEFGLIVGAIGVANGWLGAEWLTILAVAVSISFVVASPLNSQAHRLYARFHQSLQRFESGVRHADDKPIEIGAADGELLALDAASGALRWRSDISGETLARPLLKDDLVVVITIDNRLHGLSAFDGGERWIVEQSTPLLTMRGSASPVAVGTTVIAGFDNGRLLAVDLSTGDVLWEQMLSPPTGRSDLDRLADVDGQISVVGQDVYAAGYQGALAALASESGQVMWSRDISTFEGVAADWTNLYTVTPEGEIVALSRRSGVESWRQASLLRREPTLPVAFHTTVVVGDLEGYLHFFSNFDGDPVARLRLGSKAISADPVVFADRLYVQSDAGTVAAYAVQEPRRPRNEPDESEEGA